MDLVRAQDVGLSEQDDPIVLEWAAQEGRKPPEDIDWGWNVDSYFLHDVPAGVAAVKAKTGRAKIFYVGASMGGMLGYG